LRKINTFKQYYIRMQELVYLAHDYIVNGHKGVQTQEVLNSTSRFVLFLPQSIEITKFFIYKN